MNTILGEIVGFKQKDEISLLSVKTPLGEFDVLMLDFSTLKAQKGTKIQLLFKENELNLARKGAKIGIENIFESKIVKIQKGEILWQLFLEHGLSSIMSAKSGKRLSLRENDEVLCFVKADDIIIKVL